MEWAISMEWALCPHPVRALSTIYLCLQFSGKRFRLQSPQKVLIVSKESLEELVLVR
jgi:hypothetical protein